jgi:N-acetylornithine carbamoyltransferase
MKKFISFFDHSPEDILELVHKGLAIKNRQIIPSNIAGKTLGMLFFNPSLRTRVSFEMAMHRYGGKAIPLSAGGDLWNLEFQEGAVMDGSSVEHVKEGARVLSRYVDAIGVRSFAMLKTLEEDLQDTIIRSFDRYSTVPVVSMESAIEHPAQALADMMTIRERHGQEKVKFVLTWAPHVKPLPMAVGHSALLAAAHLGLDITIAHPKGFDLAPSYVQQASDIAALQGGSVEISFDQQKALKGATVVYAKNWAPVSFYGKTIGISKLHQEFKQWMPTAKSLADTKTLLHCLPVRRNVEVADSALDSPIAAIIDQAENRMWAQAALLDSIFQPA